jgi:hypothetical protein
MNPELVNFHLPTTDQFSVAVDSGSHTWTSVVHGTEITSSDPALLTVRTTYPSEPPLTLLHPPIKLTGLRPGSHVHRHRRINSSAIRCGKLVQVVGGEVHI